MWRSLTRGPVDDIVATVQGLAGEVDVAIHIGTDSQECAGHTDFVTVVALIHPARGGRVFYRKDRVHHRYDLARRLYREAELSLQVALELNDAVLQEIVVHVDANEDPRHRSSRFVHGLAGLVRGYGFQVQLKPGAWCATHVADHLVKERHRRAA